MSEEIRGALTFNGAGDHVDMDRKPEHRLERALTVEAWIYVESYKEKAGVFTKFHDNPGDESGYALLVGERGEVVLGIKPASKVENEYLSTSEGALPLKQWHHVACSFDRGTMTIYIDGKKAATRTVDTGTISYDPENNLFIGLNRSGDGEDRFFHGKIGQARLWNTARTEDEIKGAMDVRLRGDEPNLVGYWPMDEGQGGTATDLTGKAAGTIRGATWEKVPVPFPHAAKPLPEQQKEVQPKPPAPINPPTPEGSSGNGESQNVPAGAGGEGGKGGVQAIINTASVLAAAVERLNRKGVIALLEQLVDEIDVHCKTFDSKIRGEVAKLREELADQLDKLRTSSSDHAKKIDELTKTISELKTSITTVTSTIESKVTSIVEKKIDDRIPQITKQVGESLEKKVEQKVQEALDKLDTKGAQEAIDELKKKLEVVEKAAKELDDNELRVVREVIESTLKKMDVSKLLESVRIEVGGARYKLDELLRMLAARPEVREVHLGYDANNITGARFVLTNGKEVQFSATRKERAELGEVEYCFETAALNGLPAEFALRFKKSTRTLKYCDKSVDLAQYDAVYQSNVVYTLGA